MTVSGKIRPVLVLAALLVASRTALAQQSDPRADAVQAAVAIQPSPKLLPGDVVRLRIWREPDLSGEFPVDETGTVTFPKLGAMNVASMPTDSLKNALLERYSQYLRNPAIEITILRRVNVLGAVIHPGLYPVDPTMTIADVLALAGGATPDGNRSRADLLRGGKRVAVRLAVSDRVADLPMQSGDQLFVPERSWVSRNQGVIAASISATVSLIIALYRR